MNYRLLIASFCIILGALACTSVEQATGLMIADAVPAKNSQKDQASESDLVVFLTDRLGVDSDQARAGVGSIFAFAQQRMTPDDFMQLSSCVPDMSRYLASVPQSTTVNFQWGSAKKGIGQAVPGLVGQGTLNTSFQALGMNPEMANQFATVILQYLQQRSELAAMSLLQNALY